MRAIRFMGRFGLAIRRRDHAMSKPPYRMFAVALTDFLCVARTVGKQDGRILIRI